MLSQGMGRWLVVGSGSLRGAVGEEPLGGPYLKPRRTRAKMTVRMKYTM